MATFTGVSTLADLNAATLNGSAQVYGLDKINAEIQKSLASYNAQVSEMLAAFAEPVTVQTKVFDGSSSITMVEMDEFGKSRTQKDSARWTVSFPVRKFGAGVGYTLDWLNRATVGEVSRKLTSLQLAHSKNLISQMQKAMFKNSNTTFVDKFFNNETLTIRTFWNADSSTLPMNASGSTFAGASHTHYISASAVSKTSVNSLVTLVTEHDQVEDLVIVIHRGDVDTFTALSGFTALSSSLLHYNGSTATAQTIDNSDLNNQLLGYWGNLMIPVWVKPYAVQNYVLCLCLGSSDGKPLAYRQLPYTQGLKLDTKYANEPLISEEGIAFEGFGVYNRSAGAILYTSGSQWVDPTF
jgi:hypothetical protein